MTLINDSMKRVLNRTKAGAMAIGLGLSALLPNTAEAEQTIRHSGTGLGYRNKVANATYEELQKSITSPKEFIFYRDNTFAYKDDSVVYGKSDFIASAKEQHERAKTQKKYTWQDDCDGVAYAAAGALADDGYAPQVLHLVKKISNLDRMFARNSGDKETAEQEHDFYHVVFAYQDKSTGKWGCIGTGKLEDRDPKYDTIEDMVKTMKVAWQPYGYEINQTQYTNSLQKGLENLDETFGRDKWIAGKGNMTRGFGMGTVKPNPNYDSTVYLEISNEMRKSKKMLDRQDTVSKEEIVSQLVGKGYSSEVVNREFDRAYNDAKRESEDLKKMLGMNSSHTKLENKN